MNETITIPMTRAERLILNEISSLRKEIEGLQKERNAASIQEMSLNNAARLLKVHPDKVIRLIENGKLKARKYRDTERKIRYRLRAADIMEFQEQNYKLNDYSNVPDSNEVLSNVDKKFEKMK